MYALIGDTVNVLGLRAIVVTYDDDAWEYLVWVPYSAGEGMYKVVNQEDVWAVDRWKMAKPLISDGWKGRERWEGEAEEVIL